MVEKKKRGKYWLPLLEDSETLSRDKKKPHKNKPEKVRNKITSVPGRSNRKYPFSTIERHFGNSLASGTCVSYNIAGLKLDSLGDSPKE